MAATIRFDISGPTAPVAARFRFVRTYCLVALTAIGVFGIYAGAVIQPHGGFHGWVSWFLLGGGFFMIGLGLWGGWLFSGPVPDTFEIDPQGYRLSAKGRVIRSVRWEDPGVGFDIFDLRADASFVARARQDPTLLTKAHFFRPRGPLRPNIISFNIPAEVGEHLIDSAKASGLPVRSNSMPPGSRYGASLRIQVGSS